MKITDLKSYTVVSPSLKQTIEKEEQRAGAAEGFATGVAKSGLRTAIGTAGLLQDVGQRVIAGVTPATLEEVRARTGLPSLDPRAAEGQRVQEIITPEGRAEQAGALVGDIATFALPGARAEQAVRGAGALTRAAAQAGVAGGVTLAQEGEVTPEALQRAGTAAAVSGGFTLATAGLGELAKRAQENIPKALVEGLVKQTPTQRLKKGDIADFLVQTQRVGTADDILQQTDDAITTLNKTIGNQLDEAVAAGKTVKTRTLIKEITEELNEQGAEVTDDAVMEVIERLSPQTKGIFKQSLKKNISLTDANKLRSGIDKSLGDRAFLADKNTFDKNILLQFSNSLRNNVKDTAGGTVRESFEELSKNITLKQALQRRAVAGTGGNAISGLDILLGTGGFIGGGPIAGLSAVAIRRGLETPIFRTNAARAITNADRVLPILQTFTPIERAAIVSFLNQATEEGPIDETETNQDIPLQQ